MSDLFGFSSPSKPFKDIRNQRDSTAEKKAALKLELGRLIDRVPPSVRDGSVQAVCHWQLTRDAAAKVAKNSRASINDIERAINSMAQYAKELA